jgi:hypothetical protein
LADGGGEEDKGWERGRRIGGGMGRSDWASCDLPGFFLAGDKEKVGARGQSLQSHQFRTSGSLS